MSTWTVETYDDTVHHFFFHFQKSITLYDLPGHERIRYSMFEKVKKFARGIMFVVDSATIQKDVRDVAE